MTPTSGREANTVAKLRRAEALLTQALARFNALARRPRTARAWRAIASRLIHAATVYGRDGHHALASKHLASAERALALAVLP